MLGEKWIKQQGNQQQKQLSPYCSERLTLLYAQLIKSRDMAKNKEDKSSGVEAEKKPESAF